MSQSNRRRFLGYAGLGLAAAGLSPGLLPSGSRATEAVDLQDSKDRFLVDKLRGEGPRTPTEANALGPFYLRGAPYRAKVTPLFEPGIPLVISGRVWSMATSQPIPMATLDVWQADASGEYDNREVIGVSDPGDFKCRARMLTDEQGYYEFETIHPGAYQTGGSTWRPSHIHYLIQASGHETLVTQLYFRGDPRNATDSLFRESLAIEVSVDEVEGNRYERGVFDIVLQPKAD